MPHGLGFGRYDQVGEPGAGLLVGGGVAVAREPAFGQGCDDFVGLGGAGEPFRRPTP